MNRRERIVILLDNFVDVENGLRDRKGDGVHLPLMCPAYNYPYLGYPELRRLLGIMKNKHWTLYWHLSGTYMWPAKRRVHQCPRCRSTMPTWHSANFHKHGQSNVAVVPRVVRDIKPEVKAEVVDEAITWLDEHWADPGPFIPDDLKAVAA